MGRIKTPPINVEVVDYNGNLEKMLRIFNKKLRNGRILEDVRERTFYEKPSEKRNRKKRAQKRANRNNNSNVEK